MTIQQVNKNIAANKHVRKATIKENLVLSYINFVFVTLIHE